MIYLDSAASYPVLPEVLTELERAFKQVYGNSTATHSAGIAASESVEQVREQLADVIGAYPSEIIFTSGATESNNIAFKSLLFGDVVDKQKKHIVTTQIEHKCIFAITEYLSSQGYEITYVKPDKHGIISASSISKALRPDTALVSVMHVNNELGTINPIEEIGELCFKQGVLFHSDAAQSFKKIEINVDDLNVDFMSFSAHKIGGPKGIGAIYIRDLRKKQLLPVIHGAGQEDGLRGGTVAAPLINGFGVAMQMFPEYYSTIKTTNLKQYLMNELDKANVKYFINGHQESTLLSICSVTLEGTDVGLLIRVTESQICLAQGSACSSKEIEPSHVLTSLGFCNDLADQTLRLSFSHFNSSEDIDLFIKNLNSL